ncbi:MAG: hypothetical protein IMY71_11120 [Bacteroidetes bacterium]|nr:hypothetical protein [Bacteroidota bacterium]
MHLNKYGRENLQHLVQTVLKQGEILFADLEDILSETPNLDKPEDKR